MVKKVLISIFATLIVGAAGVSAYNTATAPTPVSAQDAEETAPLLSQDSPAPSRDNSTANLPDVTENPSAAVPPIPDSTEEHGNHNGQGGAGSEHGNGGGGNHGANGGGGMEFITLHGIVTASDTSFVSVVTDEGEALTFPMNAATVGFTLQPGEGVLMTGMWRGEGFFKAKEITLDSTGATYFLRGNGGGGGGGGGGKGGGGGR